MDLQQIKALIDAMQRSDLAEMEVSDNGWTLSMVRGGVAPVRQAAAGPKGFVETAAPATTGPAPAERHLHSPLAGVLHLSAAPGAPELVTPGQAVRAGDALCIIEAMKVFNEVRAERDGTIEAVLVTSGVEVEAGQLLMRFA
jgi:acetyl-CoA carboxylase biotin carboxyl carrier protein